MKTVISKEKFGPWAVITGASSGIGKEFAIQLAASGLHLVLVARRLSLLEELGRQLHERFGIDFLVVEADLSTGEGVQATIAATEHLEIGLLISNAGTGKPGKFLAHDTEHLMEIVRLNALSHITLSHHFGGKMAGRGKGGILLTGAMGAIDGLPYMAIESGTKAMVQALAKALHSEFRPQGVHITILITSPTETPVLPVLGFTRDNLPMKPLTVQQCVQAALRALSANKVSVLPGRKFRLMNALVPASVSRSMMGKIFRENNHIQ